MSFHNIVRVLCKKIRREKRIGVVPSQDMMKHGVIFRWYDLKDYFPKSNKFLLLNYHGQDIDVGYWDEKADCFRDKNDNKLEGVIRWADLLFLLFMPSCKHNHGLKNIKRYQE